MDDVEVMSTLMTVELFDGLEFAQVEQLRAAAEVRTLAPATVVCQPQTVDDCLTVVLAGRLRIESADGVPLAAVEAPGLLGEMGVLTGMARSSRVVVEDEATTLQLTTAGLAAVVEADPEITQRLLTNLCRLLYSRIHSANDEIRQLRTRLAELAPDDPLLSR